MDGLRSANAKLRERGRRAATPPEALRERALARLYARRAAVRNLISAVEQYQQEQSRARARDSAANAAKTSS